MARMNDAAHRSLKVLRDYLVTTPNASDSFHPHSKLRSAIDEALSRSTPSGTMKAWMQAQDGHYIDTAQVRTYQDSPNVWLPLMRKVDASRATKVELDGSARDYAGATVVHSTPSLLVVQTDEHVILYWRSPRPGTTY